MQTKPRVNNPILRIRYKSDTFCNGLFICCSAKLQMFNIVSKIVFGILFDPVSKDDMIFFVERNDVRLGNCITCLEIIMRKPTSYLVKIPGIIFPGYKKM